MDYETLLDRAIELNTLSLQGKLSREQDANLTKINQLIDDIEVVASPATDADRDAVALAIACTEADLPAVRVLLAAHPDPLALMDGLVRVIRTLPGQRLLDAGGEPTNESIAVCLRELLSGSFAVRT